MSNFIIRNLRMKATLWTTLGGDGYGGNLYSAPVSVDCFWEEKSELVKDSAGNDTMALSFVYLKQDVKIGDYLVFGTSNSASPVNVVGARQVIQFRRIPSVHATMFERLAYLGTNRAVQ